MVTFNRPVNSQAILPEDLSCVQNNTFILSKSLPKMKAKPIILRYKSKISQLVNKGDAARIDRKVKLAQLYNVQDEYNQSVD